MVILPEFRFLGGALCLDFMNTVGGRSGTGPLRDKFKSADDLHRWGRLAGVLPASPRVSPAVFARAIALREALYRVCTRSIEGRKPAAADLATFNRELAVTRSHERLRYAGRGFEMEAEDGSESLLAAVSRSAAELLTSDDFTRVRLCAGEDCGWMFLDTSRNRSRQWCEMRVCGNRAKARKFRQRTRRKTYSRSREA